MLDEEIEQAERDNQERTYTIRSVHLNYRGNKESVDLIKNATYDEMRSFVQLWDDFTDADALDIADHGWVCMWFFPQHRFTSEFFYKCKFRISTGK